MLKPVDKSTAEEPQVVKVVWRSRFRWTFDQLISYIIGFRETPLSAWREIGSGSTSGSNSGTGGFTQKDNNREWRDAL